MAEHLNGYRLSILSASNGTYLYCPDIDLKIQAVTLDEAYRKFTSKIKDIEKLVIYRKLSSRNGQSYVIQSDAQACESKRLVRIMHLIAYSAILLLIFISVNRDMHSFSINLQNHYIKTFFDRHMVRASINNIYDYLMAISREDKVRLKQRYTDFFKKSTAFTLIDSGEEGT